MHRRETSLRNLQTSQAGMFLQGILHGLLPRPLQGHGGPAYGTSPKISIDLLQEEIAPRLERIEDMLASRPEYVLFSGTS